MLLLVGAIAVSLSGETGTASAAGGDGNWINHGRLVPADPEFGYPRTLTTPRIGGALRQTYATDMVGDYILSGGNFLYVKKFNGPTIEQNYLAIYDSKNKSLHCEGLVTDGEIHSFAPGPFPDTALIGGKFDRIREDGGAWKVRNKLALVNLETCRVHTTWIVPGINGNVTELAVSGNRLFIGGDFTQIDGHSCLLYTSPSPRDKRQSRMPSSA